jgi:hypothetical protein
MSSKTQHEIRNIRYTFITKNVTLLNKTIMIANYIFFNLFYLFFDIKN